MQIETLKQFCDVVRLKSFSKAAESHNLTQSTLSQGVHLLEKTLNTKLIDRTKRPWKLTKDGENCYREIRELVGRFEALKKSFNVGSDGFEYNIKLSVIYSVGLRHMNSYIKEFTTKHPKSGVTLQCLHPDEVYESVQNNEVELGIVSFPKNYKGFDITPWKNEKMVIACAPDHPFAKKKKISIDQLDGIDFVNFNVGLNIRNELDNFLKQQSVKVNTVLNFDNIESIKRAVETNAGVAILPEPTIDWEVASDTLKSIQIINSDFQRPLCIISKRGKVFHRSVEIFIKQLKKL